ncbi:MAG TPA: lysophospholipid acyltransferase family protein [Herpetosiphonaceae bacterium]
MIWQYRLTRLIVGLMFRFRARLVIAGLEHVPPSGCIIASNHMSNWDPPVIAFALRQRQMRALGKQELFEIPVLGRLARFLGGIPVRRGEIDREALAECKQALQNGEPLILLPEGTRSRTGSINEAKSGVIFLAYLAKVPIVPAAISGTERMGWPGRRRTVRLCFGPPLALPAGKMSAAAREEALTDLMGAIAGMLPPGYRGAYAGAAERRQLAAPVAPSAPALPAD